jgi:hypothetical protein
VRGGPREVPITSESTVLCDLFQPASSSLAIFSSFSCINHIYFPKRVVANKLPLVESLQDRCSNTLLTSCLLLVEEEADGMVAHRSRCKASLPTAYGNVSPLHVWLQT